MILAGHVAAGIAAAGPATAGGPVVVLQVRPVDDLLVTLKTAGRNFLPQPLLGEFGRTILGRLEAQTLHGIDAKKPLGVYVTVDEGMLTGDLSKTAIVFLVPVSDEEKFGNYLTGIGWELNKNDDEYSAKVPNVPIPVGVRFRKGYAAVYTAPAKMDAGILLDPGDVLNAKETAALALHVHMDRWPDALKKQFLTAFTRNMDQTVDNYKKQLAAGDGAATTERIRIDTALRTTRWGQRWITQLVADGREISVRVDLDPKTGVLASEWLLQARPGSELAQSIAEIRPAGNDFAGIVTPDSAAHATIRAPLFISDFKEMLLQLMRTYQQHAREDKSPEARNGGATLVIEASKALARSIEADHLDIAASLRGPDKNDQFTAVGAFTLSDTAEFDKALRALIKVATPDELPHIKFDAFRVLGTAVHEFEVGDRLTPQVQKVFGKCSVFVALAPDAVYASFGPQGKDAITEIMSARRDPKPAPVARAEVSGSRILKLFKLLGASPDAFPYIEKLTAAERSTVLSIDVAGGDKLRLRIDVGLPALWVVSPKPAP
jgi:hypothetical protein